MVGLDCLPGGPEKSLHEVGKIKPKLQERPQNVANLLRKAAAMEWICSPHPVDTVKERSKAIWGPDDAEQEDTGLVAC